MARDKEALKEKILDEFRDALIDSSMRAVSIAVHDDSTFILKVQLTEPTEWNRSYDVLHDMTESRIEEVLEQIVEKAIEEGAHKYHEEE